MAETNTNPADWRDALPTAFRSYLDGRRLEEVECIVPDLAGTARGKAMPSYKFRPDESFYLPISLFYQTISGEYVDMDIENQWTEKDIVVVPDMSTASAVPWADDATLQIICDLKLREGGNLDIAPRTVLRRVLELYDAEGLRPVVAPELEFYLTKPNIDPNEPIEPPVGRTGRRGTALLLHRLSLTSG